MPYLRVHEIDLYYEVHGEGPPLVFAHGAGGNHLVWWQQVPEFARDYRVITFDHRAFGLSRDVPHGPGRRAFPLDLHALLDHLGVREFAIVAHSMGGRTATPFLWLFPDRMRALVLSGTIGGALTDEVRAIQAAHAEGVAGQSLRSRALRPGIDREDPRRAHLFHAISRLNPPRGRDFLAPSPGLGTLDRLDDAPAGAKRPAHALRRGSARYDRPGRGDAGRASGAAGQPLRGDRERRALGLFRAAGGLQPCAA